MAKNLYPKSLVEGYHDVAYNAFFHQTKNDKAVKKIMEAYASCSVLPPLPTKSVGTFGETMAEKVFVAMKNIKFRKPPINPLFDFILNDVKIEVKTCGSGDVINQLHSNKDDIYYLVLHLPTNKFYYGRSTDMYAVANKQHSSKVRMYSWRKLIKTFPSDIYEGDVRGFKKLEEAILNSN